jgi:hypothetical protein
MLALNDESSSCQWMVFEFQSDISFDCGATSRRRPGKLRRRANQSKVRPTLMPRASNFL